MGLEISQDTFDDSEFEAFQRKLEVDLAALGSLLDRPGFGEGAATIGAEVELNPIDDRTRPAPVNRHLLQRLGDPRLSLEINRYNIEVNARPVPLPGSSLAAMETELRDALTKVRAGARDLGARVVPIGILPTLRETDLGAAVMTGSRPALSPTPSMTGAPPASRSDMAGSGRARWSCSPSRWLCTRPLLPVPGAEDPAAVLRAGGVPALPALRLHHGTIWHWNRAVFDDAKGGHLRIEMRALPAGPTAADMTANAAFLLGLTLALAPRMRELTARLTFGHAHRNFYEAARVGLDAELLWPTESGSSPEAERAAALIPRLLPLAQSGLRAAGVDAGDVDQFLGIIAARTASGRTGACWQREQVDARAARLPIDQALAEMLRAYVDGSESETPVHTWAGSSA
jgi:hypothetical protein